MKRFAIVMAFSLVSFHAVAATPDCTGTNRWPVMMALTHLKNASLITNETIDHAATKVVRLASEESANGLFRQIHLITFITKAGSTFQVVTANDASSVECSMSEVTVYVISKQIGG